MLPAKLEPSNASWIIPAGAWYGDEIGGGYRIATELAEHLASRGWQVHYVAPAERARRTEASLERGVTVWRYPKPRASGKGPHFLNLTDHLNGSLAAAKCAAARIAPERTVVLNGHGFLQYCGALDLKKRPADRRTICVPSPLVDEYLSQTAPTGLWARLRSSAVRRTFASLEKQAYRASGRVIGYSRYTLSLLESRYPAQIRDKLFLSPGYVDLEAFNTDEMPRDAARQALGEPAWKNADLYFFTLRRLVDRMGLDTLIHAAARLKAELVRRQVPSRVRFVVGGDGPLRGGLEKLAEAEAVKDMVYFIGRVPEDKLALCYRAADAFVLPTRALECFGLIILEAFACGTPVIATPVGSIPEIMGPFGAQGMTRDTGAEALAEKMMAFVTQKIYDIPGFKLREYAAGYDKRVNLEKLAEAALGG